VRAAEGVVRILHLQLQPAELGTVTIKMRLSGDNLEIELQAASEETAKLLRHDTEKLSALLRGSGYRPDVITIHSGQAEANQQNGAPSQRQPAFGQPPQQDGSQQGGAGQQGQPQREGDRYEADRKGERIDAGFEDVVADRRTGGIYL
jgi:flagellar hook-length control protein FliK